MKGGNDRMHYYLEQIRERRRAEGKQPGIIESGFTLIELLIVIVVLGILAAVVIFALSGVTSSSAQSSCNADAKSVEVAVSAYNTQKGTFPSGASQAAVQALLVPTYLRTWPSNGSHYTITLDTTGNGTVYATTATGAGVNYDTNNPCGGAQ